MKKTIVTICILSMIAFTAQGQTEIEQNPDYAGVHAAITDYVEGLYQADSTRIIRSVHPDLRKRGFWYSAKRSEWNDNVDMTYDQLVNLAARWNKSGNRVDENTPKEIKIYDINERTASGKLIAQWGMDYFQLAKIDGKWMIMNVLWQSLSDEG